MKILLVSWSILPQSGGTSVIVENLAKNFIREEMLVVGSAMPFQKIDLQRPKKQPEFRYFASEMYLFGRGYRYFTWFRKWRYPTLVRYLKKTIQAEKIDHVVGVYPNPFYCLAACQAAKELGVPFSSYFHNTYIENSAITDPKAAVIQQEIFDYSRHIFVMSKGMQRFYEQKYQLDKFIPLVHTFVEYPPVLKKKPVAPTNKKQYKLVAIGNFNESNLDATKRFLSAIKKEPKYSIDFYTHVPKLLLQKRGLDTTLFHHRGSVAPDAIHAILQNYDICVLTHGFTGGYGAIEYETIFPTRTIPFLLAGKPIFAHSPSGSFLNDFIKENNCAELVDQANETAILEGLERIISDVNYQQELVTAAQKTSQQFYGKRVAEAFKNSLANT